MKAGAWGKTQVTVSDKVKLRGSADWPLEHTLQSLFEICEGRARYGRKRT
jgi:hypothetical protein